MKKAILTPAVGACLIAAALGSSGTAAAVATSPQNAAATIQELQSKGYRVILNKVGGEPLSQCSVTSIRRGHAVTETVPAGGGDTQQKVVYTPVYVDVGC
jgi:NADPH:quinone reductase-like Zn-dependent oxidoreductase